ncbi:type I restriction-modification system subunit M N-terminal domain-containing protein, partial [Klebsiella pneumoniae subsp. ozaenae]
MNEFTGSAASQADFIWKNAEDLWGDFKHTDFGKIILPFTLLRGTVAKLAMRQPFVLFKGLTFQKLCLPGAFRPGDHHN